MNNPTRLKQQVKRDQRIEKKDVNKICEVHNGRSWVKVRPTGSMVGLKFGEFAKTRIPRSMGKKK